MESILKAAEKSSFSKSAVEELITLLPGEDDEFDRLLKSAADERRDMAVAVLMIAGIAGGRTVDAGYFVKCADLLPSLSILCSAAAKCGGDVQRALLDAVDRGKMRVEMVAGALFSAALWNSRRSAPESVDELLLRMRALSRKTSVDFFVQVILMATCKILLEMGITLPNGLEPLSEKERGILDDLIDEAEKPIADLLQEETAPSGGYGYTVRRAVPKTGRNEPCHCGSGKKYKRCCYTADRERLRNSSDVPGVTVDEIQENPEDYITRRRMYDMAPFELVRIDPCKVPPELLLDLLFRLVAFRELGAAVAMYEKTGEEEILAPHFEVLLARAIMDPNVDHAIVDRILALREKSNLYAEACEIPLGVRLLKGGESVRILDELEQEFQENFRRGDFESINRIANQFMARGYPALGVCLARSIIFDIPPFEADFLVESIMDAKDTMHIFESEPYEEALEHVLSSDLIRRSDTDQTAEKYAEAAETLEEQREEIARLRRQMCESQEQLKRMEKRSSLPAENASDDRRESKRDHISADDLKELKEQIQTLKARIAERNEERRKLRDDLVKAQTRLDDSDTEKSAADHKETTDREDTLFETVSGSENMTVRIPVFSARFQKDLNTIPSNVARRAITTSASLAAGDVGAFRDVKRLKSNKQFYRARLGISYRMLFTLNEKSLTAEAVFHRKDLEKTINNDRLGHAAQ